MESFKIKYILYGTGIGHGFIKTQATNNFIKDSLKKRKLKNKVVNIKVHKKRELNYKEPIIACRKKTKTLIVDRLNYFNKRL